MSYYSTLLDIYLDDKFKFIGTAKVFGVNGEKNRYELKIAIPKSKSSRRELPLPSTLKPELRKLEILVAEERLRRFKAYLRNQTF